MSASNVLHASTPAEIRVDAAVRALTEISWMARRSASQTLRQEEVWMKPLPADAPEQATIVDDALWTVIRLAARYAIPGPRVDQTANRDWSQSGVVEVPSCFLDGSPVYYTPANHAEIEARIITDPDSLVQEAITALHPHAHIYADGRATYATSMFNDATRVLRRGDWDLSETEKAGRSIWVRDAMGDSCTGLNDTEIAERENARITV